MKATESFIDEVVVEVAGGRGGDGSAHFRRERFNPRGGPDGGDGGNGGDVVFVADHGLATLLDQKLQPRIEAEDGEHGSSNGRYGKSGADRVLRLPVGTVAHEFGAPRDAAPLVDLVEHGQRWVAAHGGSGGRGNIHFATATRQAPDHAESGRPGETRRLRLSLKLLADVGLLGLPNAGKSTLLRRISAARPRVAAYPFTTLVPQLGVVDADPSGTGGLGRRRFVVADIPGLIEGASEGAGLGDRFLRHVERTRLLIHLVDVGTPYVEGRGPDAALEDWALIRRELASYDAALAARPEIVALNKIDLLPDAERESRLAALETALRERGRSVARVSGATGEGIDALLRGVAHRLDATPDEGESGT